MRAWMMFGVVACSGFVVGCGSSDPLDRVIAQTQVLVDVYCSCPAAAGTTTEAECRARIAEHEVTESEDACRRRVFEAHEAELRPVFECQYDALVENTECVRAALALMCPPSSEAVDRCNTETNEAVAACPQPSTQTEAELAACFASRT